MQACMTSLFIGEFVRINILSRKIFANPGPWFTPPGDKHSQPQGSVCEEALPLDRKDHKVRTMHHAISRQSYVSASIFHSFHCLLIHFLIQQNIY